MKTLIKKAGEAARIVGAILLDFFFGTLVLFGCLFFIATLAAVTAAALYGIYQAGLVLGWERSILAVAAGALIIVCLKGVAVKPTKLPVGTIPAGKTYMVLDTKGYVLSEYDFEAGGYVAIARACHPDALRPLMAHLDEEGVRWIVEDLQGEPTEHTCRIHRELLQSIFRPEYLPQGITASHCVVGAEG